MNKRQVIVSLVMFVSSVFLFGLSKCLVMYKQPNGQFYDSWGVSIYGTGLFDNPFLFLLYRNKFPTIAVVLVVGCFLIYALRDKKRERV